jgi:hypothetical protein
MGYRLSRRPRLFRGAAPARASARAQPRPANPPPTMTTCLSVRSVCMTATSLYLIPNSQCVISARTTPRIFFTTAEFCHDRQSPQRSPWTLSRSQARAKVHSRSSVDRETSRAFAASGEAQAPEIAGLDGIPHFARLRLSGCQSDSVSNVSCRGRPGQSSPTRPLSSQPAFPAPLS